MADALGDAEGDALGDELGDALAPADGLGEAVGDELGVWLGATGKVSLGRSCSAHTPPPIAPAQRIPAAAIDVTRSACRRFADLASLAASGAGAAPTLAAIVAS
ncbi:MAG: hypothetical protein NVV57_09450 [Demequina sp.]|nr:hypothetical protein [Demequina sp.]